MKETQRQRVERALLNRGYITARQAYHMGIMRLSAIIWDIRNDSFSDFSKRYWVRTDIIKVKNRDGSYSFVAKYILEKRLSDVEAKFVI